MADILKDIKKNWIVLGFVLVQAVFVIGATSQESKQREERILKLEIAEGHSREILIEMRTDIRWIKRTMGGR